MRIIVTGASGFVGAAVVRRAIEAGHEVIAACRLGTDHWRLPPIWEPNAIVRFDLAGESYGQTALGRLLRSADAVIHCAWENGRKARCDPQAQLRSFSGTTALFQAALRAGVKRVVAVGSQAEGGRTAYARAKSAARDVMMLDAGNRLAWARLYSVYGPGERRSDSLLPRLVRRSIDYDLADADEMADPPPFALESTGEHYWHYLYEDDAADTLLALADPTARAGEIDVFGYPPMRLREILDFVRRRHFPSMPAIVYGTRRDADLRCGPALMPPKVTLAEGVKRLVDAMREEATR